MNFIEHKAQEAQQAKAAQWAEIKEREPELAEFLKQLAATFGKLAKVEVKWK